MIIGTRLRKLREERRLSQGDIEKRTGLLRCYISRVENGHTVPSLETLERLASALEIPLFQLFYEGDDPPPLTNLSRRETTEELVQDALAGYLDELTRTRNMLGTVDRRICLSQPSRPDGDSNRPLLRLPHQRQRLPQVAGLDAPEAPWSCELIEKSGFSRL